VEKAEVAVLVQRVVQVAVGQQTVAVELMRGVQALQIKVLMVAQVTIFVTVVGAVARVS
jgi:hypothetical protein